MSEERKSPEGEDAIIYRYDRAKRLERAPEDVQWLAAKAKAKKPGLLSSLLATRASRILFFTIVGMALYFFASPLFEGGAKRSGSLGEARFSASALYYEGRVLVALARKGGARLDGEIESLSVTARAEKRGEEAGAANFEFAIGEKEREEYRMAVNAGGGKPERIRLRISTGARKIELLLPVD